MNSLLKTWTRIKTIFAPPIFEDQEKTRISALLTTVLYSLILLLVLVNVALILVSLLAKQALPNPLVSVIATVVFVVLIIFTRLGFVRQVSLLLAFVVSGVITFSLARSVTLISVTTIGYMIAIIIAGMLSGGGSALTVAVFSVLSLGTLNYFAVQGITQTQPLTVSNLITIGALLTMAALLLGLTSRSLKEALENARRNEAAQLEANQNLRNLQANLEQRVADRTKAFATAAEVGRKLSAVTNPRQLATEVVEQIQHAFNFYYAQIYLMDDSGENLVLTGATGEAGAAMLAREHRVKKGHGLVGRAADTNKYVFVPDVSKEEDWLPNEMLSETKSETAVPISIGDHVFGVLDVQHNIVNGMTVDDVTLLESLANQAAISLQNAHSFEESKAQADFELLVNTIGQKIQRATTVEDTLQVAIRELGMALGATRVKANLQPDHQS